LPVISYGCATWYFILKEEHMPKLQMLENEVLKKIFVMKDYVSKKSRILLNLYRPLALSGSPIKEIIMGRA
jgi:hypothetical protein